MISIFLAITGYLVTGFFVICLIERYHATRNLNSISNPHQLDSAFIWPVIFWPLSLWGFIIFIMPFDVWDIFKPLQKIRWKIVTGGKK